MKKQIFNLLIIIFIFSFIFIVIKTYISDEYHKSKIDNRKQNLSLNKEFVDTLPILKNNIDDSIKFNNGYLEESNKKTNRNFWDLFKN
tara:strand:+ start:1136 stop:1399 length:264 start_codon:yes stop_codon:yes gene_type:complete